MNNKEIRSFERKINIRSLEGNNESRSIEMYAIVFDSNSHDLGGFIERIIPSSLDSIRETIKRSDIKVYVNHNDKEIPLARSIKGEGSLELIVDEYGVLCRFEMPKTSVGDALLEAIKRKDISACSFGFLLNDDDYFLERDKNGEFIKDENGSYLLTITDFEELGEVSLVNVPAYKTTEIMVRSLKKIKELEIKNIEQKELFKEVEEYLLKNK